MKALNFGSLNLDHIYRVDSFVAPGETKACADYRVAAGGKGLNQSIALACAGLETYHAGCIGPDAGLLTDTLSSRGVRADYLKPLPASTGHAVIQVNGSGENCILLYRGTNGMLTEPYVDEVLSCFGRDDIAVLQNETNLVPYIMRAAYRREMRIAFNAAPIGAEVRAYPLDLATWLFVNEIEGGFLSGCTEPEEIAVALGRMYPNTHIVLTLGAGGSLSYTGGRTLHQKAFPVQAVDTTAAGDAFIGYFLCAAAGGQDTAAALRLGAAAGALAVTRPGAAGSIPLRDEVDSFLSAR